MTDLVAKDARQLRLVVHVGEDLAGYIHVTSGQGKGVDHVRIKYRKGPRQIGSVGNPREFGPGVANIVLEAGRLNSPELALNLGIGLASYLDFLALREEGDLLLPRDRVAGTSGQGGAGEPKHKTATQSWELHYDRRHAVLYRRRSAPSTSPFLDPCGGIEAVRSHSIAGRTQGLDKRPIEAGGHQRARAFVHSCSSTPKTLYHLFVDLNQVRER